MLQSIEISQISFLNDCVDFCNTFIVPIISAFGILTNLINVVVFSQKELKDVTFKYFKLQSLSNSIYLMIAFFLFVPRCGIYCQISHTFTAQLYLYVFHTYIKGIFAILSICIQITVGFYRFLIVINHHNTSKFQNYKLITSFLLVFSIIFYLPNLITKKIQLNNEINNSSMTYTTNFTEFGQTNWGKWLVILVVTIFRGFIASAIIIIVGIITLIKLNKHINQSNKLKVKKLKNYLLEVSLATFDKQKSNSRSFFHYEVKSDATKETLKAKRATNSNRNITIMVISSGFLFVVGNIPNSIAYVYQQYVDTDSLFFRTLAILANLLLFIVQGSDIFIYYLFNKQYKNGFRKIFKLK